MITLHVNTASTPGGDGTTNGTVGPTRAFATLGEAVRSLPGALLDQTLILCDGSGGPDLDPPAQADFDFTTTAVNYLEIRAAAGARAPFGVPTDANPRYRAKVTNRNGIYNNVPSHIRFNGLVVYVTVNDGGSYVGLKSMNANQVASDIDCRIEQCIVVGNVVAGSLIGVNTRWPDPAGIGIATVESTLALDCSIGFANDAGPNAPNPGGFAVYAHNTAARCNFGYVDDGDMYVIGCLATASGTRGFTGAFWPVSSNNAEDDGNGAPGAGSLSGQVFTFVNAAGNNYNLDALDVGAKDLGPIFPQGNTAVDLAGSPRLMGAAVDVGAFEMNLGGPLPPDPEPEPTLIRLPKRLVILEALAALASTITIANGYHSNAGAALYLGPAPELGDDDPDAAIAIVPRDDTIGAESGRIGVVFPVEVQAIAKVSIAQPWRVVEFLIADLKTAIELEDRTLGSLLKGQIKRGPTRTLERAPGSLTAGAAILYLCPYIEEWGNPTYGSPLVEEET